MASLSVIFYMYVILFAIIGGMRGWAKELLVGFSVILALFLTVVFETIMPVIKNMFQDQSSQQFWFRVIILVLLVFFGYQSPSIGRLAGTAKKERISDTLLGVFLGAINGYLIFGTLWYFMDYANYPLKYFMAPDPNTPLGVDALAMISRLPPSFLLSGNWIFVAVGLAFLFVMVVFI
jgi:uncharacterized membrane protein required for colicin V production